MGSLLLPVLLKSYSAYTIMRRSFEIRVVSGLMHVASMSSWLAGWPATTLALMLLSRALHGLTLLLVPLAVICKSARARPHRHTPSLACAS